MRNLSQFALSMLLAVSCRTNADSRKEVKDVSLAPPASVSLKQGPRLTSCYEADAWTCAVEAAVARKTNALRRGLQPIQQSFETSFVARHHSQEQLDAHVLSHDGFPTERQATLQENFPNVKLFFTAENVAWMTSDEADAERVADALVKMWWESPGHRSNMLGNHRYIGVGVVRGQNQVYATQLFH